MTYISSAPIVSIIIVNWNGLNYLDSCLESVFNLDYNNFEVIFVDNGSKDGSVNFVNKRFPKVKIIQNKKNLGFAKGNNVGIKKAKGKYIATLNNDTKVDPSWLKELVSAAENDEKIGTCASKILIYDTPKLIDSAGIFIARNGGGENRGAILSSKRYCNKKTEVFGACAAAALYRKKMLKDIGYFDQDYFAYFEDVDLAWRAQLAGWKCMFIPSAIVYHKGGGTSRKEASSFTKYLCERNRIWNVLKNASKKHIIYNLGWILYKQLRSFLYALIKNSPEILRAKIDAITSLKEVLIKRKIIQSKKIVNDSEIEKWMI